MRVVSRARRRQGQVVGEGYETARRRFDDRRWGVAGSAVCDIRVDVHAGVRQVVSRTAEVRDYIRDRGHGIYT